jgi:hypothetical protein
MAENVAVSGVLEMVANLRNFKKNFPGHVAEAMRIEAEVDAIECKKRSPVYTGPVTPSSPIPGVLQDSIHVEGPNFKNDIIYVEIVAGGEAGAYAIPQHENLTYHHEIGQAKYIESVMMESRDTMAARIAKHIDFAKLKK